MVPFFLFAPSVRDFIFVGKNRQKVKTSISFFWYDTETTLTTTYQVRGVCTAAVRAANALVYSRCPDRSAVRKT